MDAKAMRRAAGSVVLVLAACVGVSGCASAARDRPAKVTSGVVDIGPASDFPAGSVSTKFVERYGIVVSNDDGTVVAIWPRCSEKGEMARWNAAAGQFECANGSHFDILGRPTKGPATMPLPATAARPSATGTLTVDLDKLHGM